MIFSPDLLAALPPKSRAKAARLDADRDAAHAAMIAADDRLFDAHTELARLEAEVAAKLSDMPSHRLDADDRKRVAGVLDAKRPDIDRLREAKDRASRIWRGFDCLTGAAKWLREARAQGLTLRHAAADAPDAADHAEAVGQLRAGLAELEHAWGVAEDAPATLAELEAATLAALDDLAKRGRPVADPRARAGDPFRLLSVLELRVSNAAAAGNALPFLVWALRDPLAEKLTAELAALDLSGARSFDDREAAFTEIALQRLDFERLEEAHISAAEARDQHIGRRPDADPRAILEVAE